MGEPHAPLARRCPHPLYAQLGELRQLPGGELNALGAPRQYGAGWDNKGKRGQRKELRGAGEAGAAGQFPRKPAPGGGGYSRGWHTALVPLLPGDPDAASGDGGGDPARTRRGSQVTWATPSPRRRRIPRGSSLPAPALPPILLCPAARESLLPRRETGQEGVRPGGGLEGKAGGSRLPKLPAATGCACPQAATDLSSALALIQKGFQGCLWAAADLR